VSLLEGRGEEQLLPLLLPPLPLPPPPPPPGHVATPPQTPVQSASVQVTLVVPPQHTPVQSTTAEPSQTPAQSTVPLHVEGDPGHVGDAAEARAVTVLGAQLLPPSVQLRLGPLKSTTKTAGCLPEKKDDGATTTDGCAGVKKLLPGLKGSSTGSGEVLT
jgi:hypothetical protein